MTGQSDPGLLLIFLTYASLVVAAALFDGCGDVPPPLCSGPAVAAETQAIVGGEPSSDRRSAIYLTNGRGACTGFIVSEHTIVTAAHCSFGTLVAHVPGEEPCTVTDFEIHPDYSFPKRDLAVWYVEKTLPGPYIPLGLGGLECSSYIAQGFGIGSPSGQLAEREVFEVDRTENLIYVSAGPCFGDSGSALIAQTAEGPRAIGVMSIGVSYDCNVGGNGYVSLVNEENLAWLISRVK